MSTSNQHFLLSRFSFGENWYSISLRTPADLSVASQETHCFYALGMFKKLTV